MGNEGVVRTVIWSKGSLYATIPSQLSQLYGIKKGDKVEWLQGRPGELILRKKVDELQARRVEPQEEDFPTQDTSRQSHQST
jgi:bifunctional DNA-binding transcriptional regulator/antitoxin component of YhaV-PrlF toxin-antitoxin module